jgi:hypothetical protein
MYGLVQVAFTLCRRSVCERPATLAVVRVIFLVSGCG